MPRRLALQADSLVVSGDTGSNRLTCRVREAWPHFTVKSLQWPGVWFDIQRLRQVNLTCVTPLFLSLFCSVLSVTAVLSLSDSVSWYSVYLHCDTVLGAWQAHWILAVLQRFTESVAYHINRIWKYTTVQTCVEVVFVLLMCLCFIYLKITNMKSYLPYQN